MDASEGFDVKPERGAEEDSAAKRTTERLQDRSSLPQPMIVMEAEPVAEAACMPAQPLPAQPSIFERFSKAIETKDGAHEAGRSPEDESPTEQEEAPVRMPVSVFEKLSRKGNGS